MPLAVLLAAFLLLLDDIMGMKVTRHISLTDQDAYRRLAKVFFIRRFLIKTSNIQILQCNCDEIRCQFHYQYGQY